MPFDMGEQKNKGDQPDSQERMSFEVDKYQQIPAVYFETLSHDELSQKLKAFVHDLLLNDFSRLCNLIYRHDVAESKFNKALSYNDLEKQAAAIAELVIDREMEKRSSRKAYREHKQQQAKSIGDKDIV